MKNNVWDLMTSLDEISVFLLQLNNTTIINSNKRTLVCFTFIYYFNKSLVFYYSVHFVFLYIFQFKMVTYYILYDKTFNSW